jgi:hypothetical protein
LEIFKKTPPFVLQVVKMKKNLRGQKKAFNKKVSELETNDK